MKLDIKILIVILILGLAFFLRFYKLGSIPAGLHRDAASQGYNAFSLLQTGKDRYGQAFPILFRSFGSYQPPLYTYLTIIPIGLLGNSQFAAHFISALSGSLLVLVSFLFINSLFSKNEKKFIWASMAALTVAISPWSVFFSRLAVEANLGVLLFSLSILLFVYSLKKVHFLPVASLTLGISTHAYYSERLIAVIFLPFFLFLFKKNLLVTKKMVILALILFAITQIPHLLILNSGAFARRFEQVSYFGNQIDNQSRILNIIKTTLNNYIIYYSPKNLFFDSDINLGRTMPGLSVFYNWFLIPFMGGIWYLLKNKTSLATKVICLLLLLTPISASFTDDFFYPLRTLDFLWALTLLISFGLVQIYLFLGSRITKLLLLGTLLSYSLFSLYISYFILFRYEKAKSYGYPYIKLMDKISQFNDKQIIIDLARDPGIAVRIAYLKNFPPQKIQSQLHHQLKSPYYSNLINEDEIYNIDNIDVKPLSFGDACKNGVIMVGDQLTFSPEQLKEHKLQLEFKVPDLSGKPILFGYSTHPKESCPSNR